MILVGFEPVRDCCCLELKDALLSGSASLPGQMHESESLGLTCTFSVLELNYDCVEDGAGLSHRVTSSSPQPEQP